MKVKSIAIVLLITVSMLVASSAVLGAYPERPINYIICFNPGGESDLTARLQQPLLEKVLKTKVVISYKIGGGGALGCSLDNLFCKPHFCPSHNSLYLICFLAICIS